MKRLLGSGLSMLLAWGSFPWSAYAQLRTDAAPRAAQAPPPALCWSVPEKREFFLEMGMGLRGIAEALQSAPSPVDQAGLALPTSQDVAQGQAVQALTRYLEENIATPATTAPKAAARQVLIETLARPSLLPKIHEALSFSSQNDSAEILQRRSLVKHNLERLVDSTKQDSRFRSRILEALYPVRQRLWPSGATKAFVREGIDAHLHSLFDGAATSPDISGSVEKIGRVPTSRVLLQRAREMNVTLAQIGSAIARAKDFPAAARNFQELGILDKGDADPRGTAFEWLLRGLWHEAVLKIPPQFPLDESWDIPAHVVRKEGITFFLHGITHGLYKPFGLKQNKKLIDRLEANNLPLYSEQRMPDYYGYTHGKETLDHNVMKGIPVELRPAQRTSIQPLARIMIHGLVLANYVFFSLVPLLFIPNCSPVLRALSLVGLVIGLMANIAYWALSPIAYLLTNMHALLRWITGHADEAAYLHRLADYVFKRERIDHRQAQRLNLPVPLELRSTGTYTYKETSFKRSRSMAEVILQDALRRGLTEVHIITGYDHVWEIAWTISQAVIFSRKTTNDKIFQLVE